MDADKYHPEGGNKDGSDAYDDIHKMVRKIYYNPVEPEKVDSIVYSKVVKKVNGFDGLYLSFAPECLMKDKSNGKVWGYQGANGACQEQEKFNFVARPEVFDSFDGTAPFGSILVRGTDKNHKWQNGNQALNPFVSEEDTEKYGYYIVRLNVTTSTYRIEFVDDPYVDLSNGIRTYSSQANLRLPADGSVRAYAAHSFDKDKNVVNLYRLKYVPANEGVVLVSKDAVLNEKGEVKLNIITDAEEGSPVVDDLKDA